jgi:hypothetical protein
MKTRFNISFVLHDMHVANGNEHDYDFAKTRLPVVVVQFFFLHVL